MKLVGITQDNFPTYWPAIKPLLTEACERSRGQFTADQAVQQLVNGIWWFWVGVDETNTVKAFAVTEILEFSAGALVGNILITTGTSRKDWKHLIGDLETWAKDQGCERLQTWARKGWVRELPDYKISHVLLERGLD